MRRRSSPRFRPIHINRGSTYNVVKNYYALIKKKQSVEPSGTCRPLSEDELLYYKVAKLKYVNTDLFSKNKPWCDNIPSTWKTKICCMKADKKMRNWFCFLMQFLIDHAKLSCNESQRFSWLETMNDIKESSNETKLILWLMFCKSTNGTADNVVCPHFKNLCGKFRNLKLQDVVNDELLTPRILRKTPNWVKNSITLNKVFKHLLHLDEVPWDFSHWMRYREFQSKTVSLFFHAMGKQAPTVPVDMHVQLFNDCFQIAWITRDRNELSYYLQQLVPENQYVLLNDCVGSIGQTLSSNNGREKAIEQEKLRMSNIRSTTKRGVRGDNYNDMQERLHKSMLAWISAYGKRKKNGGVGKKRKASTQMAINFA